MKIFYMIDCKESYPPYVLINMFMLTNNDLDININFIP